MPEVDELVACSQKKNGHSVEGGEQGVEGRGFRGYREATLLVLHWRSRDMVYVVWFSD